VTLDGEPLKVILCLLEKYGHIFTLLHEITTNEALMFGEKTCSNTSYQSPLFAAQNVLNRSSVVEVLRPVPAEHQGLALAGWLRLPAQHALQARKAKVVFCSWQWCV